MIGRLQKTALTEKLTLEILREGRFPTAGEILNTVRSFLSGRRFGAPLVHFRPAVLNQPIGGEDGFDIQHTFEELVGDLDLLYQAQLQLPGRALDLYDIFAVRRDRLALRLGVLRQDVLTLLAQQAAGGRASVTDSFNTLDLVDRDRTTAQVDLEEGLITLPIDSLRSVSYDGSKVQLLRSILPPGVEELGPTFQSIFNPYRLDAWYLTLPLGSQFEAHLNVTGADYFKGQTEEVTLNALRIEPAGPLHIEIDWSPDSFNWHSLNPHISRTIRDRTTFHFDPITVGYLRFRIRQSEEISQTDSGRPLAVGIKRVELMKRGFSQTAAFYSTEHRFNEPIHTVVVETQTETPFGTKISPYVSQSPDGPWVAVGAGPIIFESRLWFDDQLKEWEEEDTGTPATLWKSSVSPSTQPLPGTGELIAGRDQVQISAYRFDWRQRGDRLHVPEVVDWEPSLSEIRTGLFQTIGEIGTVDVPVGGFSTAKSPVAFDVVDGQSYMVLGILGGDGGFVLQPGFNYRLRAYLWCSAPTTLENQRMGVVNTGGTADTQVAPFSLFVNGQKLFQQTDSVTSVAALDSSAYRTSVALQQGWNSLEILIQLPADLVAGQAGLAADSVYLYFQPNLFASNLAADLDIDYIQAYRDPWKRVSEFELRYNVPIGLREYWSWKTDINTGIIEAVLLNHDPTNSRSATTPHPSMTTIDGTNSSVPVILNLRDPWERDSTDDFRRLYFRADFSQEEGASSPCSLSAYRILVN